MINPGFILPVCLSLLLSFSSIMRSQASLQVFLTSQSILTILDSSSELEEMMDDLL